MANMSASVFKVIVVGGGPVGLTAAHALEKAGIDFLLFERRPRVVIDAGSNLVLSPSGLRTVAQLGLMDHINAVSTPLSRIDRVDHYGRDIGDVEWFKQMKLNTGLAPRVISRHDLTKVLYETLPVKAQQKIFANKKLSDIATTADGVVATCVDGSSYSANILVAADGAHSLVRQLMRSLALEAGSTELNAGTPFETTYQCLWIRFPRPSKLPVGTTCEAHGYKSATQLFVGEESGVTGVYDRLEQPTRERIRFTQADQDALIERLGHLPVTPNAELTLRDVYESRLEAGLVSLEEGVVDHWSWDGRIVLTGDSAHKFTPSTGAGCNAGMMDIVVLVNELHAALQNARLESDDINAVPSRDAIASAFKAYQVARQDTVISECAGSSRATITATWETGVHKFLDRRVMSRHFIQRFLIKQGFKNFSSTPTMQFLTGQGQADVMEPWRHSAPQVPVQA